MAFIASFFQYAIIMILLAAVAFGGVAAGKMLRARKDAQTTGQNEK